MRRDCGGLVKGWWGKGLRGDGVGVERDLELWHGINSGVMS